VFLSLPIVYPVVSPLRYNLWIQVKGCASFSFRFSSPPSFAACCSPFSPSLWRLPRIQSGIIPLPLHCHCRSSRFHNLFLHRVYTRMPQLERHTTLSRDLHCFFISKTFLPHPSWRIPMLLLFFAFTAPPATMLWKCTHFSRWRPFKMYNCIFRWATLNKAKFLSKVKIFNFDSFSRGVVVVTVAYSST